MIISQVVAVSKNRAIGANGDLPWRLLDDMQYFTEVTTGHPVIMGSKTYESIPAKNRPLANRSNIVLTRDTSKKYEGAEAVTTIGDALKSARTKPGAEEVMIIGGGSIYQQTLPITHRVYLTEVDSVIEDADTFFPELDEVRWSRNEVGHFKKSDRNQFGGTYYVYDRTGQFPIVEPANGRNEAYRKQLSDILEEAVCPFCPGGETLRGDQPILKTTKYWFVKFNQHPLANAAYHFMITPLRHFTATEEMTYEEWQDLGEIRKWLKSEYAMTGDAIYARSGEPLVTGATVSHYHMHIIVPAGVVEVTFGQFPRV